MLTVLLIGPCTAAWTQDKKSDIFSVTPSFGFSWYPSVAFGNELSTNTEVDLNNFGMSVIMSLKLFDKVGASLNLKIDDPTFKKLVDIAGYVTAYYFLLKFDYHSFGGTVTWTGDTPNPIPGGEYNFRNQWTYISLLFRLDQLPNIPLLGSLLYDWGLWGRENLGAIGIGYARFDMPLEYRVQPNRGLSNPGFGLVKGESWGLSVLWDTLTWSTERPASYRRHFMDYIWLYLDIFNYPFPIPGKGETDAKAITWMSNANDGASVDGNIDKATTYSIFKGVLGLQYIWYIGQKGRIGLGVGAELLTESIEAKNSDIAINFSSTNIGPTVRVSARW